MILPADVYQALRHLKRSNRLVRIRNRNWCHNHFKYHRSPKLTPLKDLSPFALFLFGFPSSVFSNFASLILFLLLPEKLFCHALQTMKHHIYSRLPLLGDFLISDNIASTKQNTECSKFSPTVIKDDFKICKKDAAVTYRSCWALKKSYFPSINGLVHGIHKILLNWIRSKRKRKCYGFVLDTLWVWIRNVHPIFISRCHFLLQFFQVPWNYYSRHNTVSLW